MPRPRLPLLAVLVVSWLAGCDSITAPAGVSSTGASASSLNISGTWSGTATDVHGTMHMSWRLTQTNRNVSGTITATTPFGVPVYTAGSLAGTLSGSTLVFAVTIPRGAIQDFPDCTASFSGTAPDVTTAGLAGTYTGNDSCRGEILDGRVNLIRE